MTSPPVPSPMELWERLVSSTRVARRYVSTALIIPPRVESTRKMAMTLRLSVGGKT